MGDYTDGGGWAKLDATAARRLSEAIATFPPSKVGTWSRVLLTLYSTVGPDGTTTVGCRTLAEMCGVPRGTVRRLMEKLEESGLVVNDGQARDGGFELRRFSWVGRKPRPNGPGPKKPPKRPTLGRNSGGNGPGVGRKSRQNAPHQNTEYSEGGWGRFDAPPPPSKDLA